MTPCKQVLTAVRGHSNKEKEKEKTMTPLTFIARVGLSLQCRCPHLLLACRSPCVCCHCPWYSLLPCHSHIIIIIVPAVCSLSSPSSLAFIILAILLFVFALLYVWGVVSNVVSTSSSPYEQWLTGRVGVLCDVAPIGTLQAEACSGGVGWGVACRGDIGVAALSLLSNLKKKKKKLVSKEKEIKVRNIWGPKWHLLSFGPFAFVRLRWLWARQCGRQWRVGHRGGCVKPIGVGGMFPFGMSLTKEENLKESKKHLVKVIINQ